MWGFNLEAAGAPSFLNEKPSGTLATFPLPSTPPSPPKKKRESKEASPHSIHPVARNDASQLPNTPPPPPSPHQKKEERFTCCFKASQASKKPNNKQQAREVAPLPGQRLLPRPIPIHRGLSPGLLRRRAGDEHSLADVLGSRG